MARSVVFLLGFSLVVAACGGSKHAATTAASPLDAVNAALKKTLAAGSESLALKANVTTSGETVNLAGDGAVDTKKRRGTLSLHIDAGPIATAADEVLIGRVVYVRSPALPGPGRPAERAPIPEERDAGRQ
jgi:hypothetical protein